MDLNELAGPWADYDIDRLNAPRPAIVEGYKAARRAAAAPRMLLGEPYGPGEREKVDLLAPAAANAPAVVFIHGGYWRGGAREDRRFPAGFFVPRGVAWIALGYPLTGTTPLPEIVDSVRRAVSFPKRRAGALGLDAERLVLAGNSAGAHLAALGAAVEQIPGAGHDHFSIIGEIGREGALTRALLKKMIA